MTLGSDSSDLKVNNDLIMDHDNEKLISGMPDLEFSGISVSVRAKSPQQEEVFP